MKPLAIPLDRHNRYISDINEVVFRKGKCLVMITDFPDLDTFNMVYQSDVNLTMQTRTVEYYQNNIAK